MTYEWTEDMGEISGMGGGYEQACRDMVFAGIAWFEANPDAEPQFSGYKGIYGIINEDNEDAKALSGAVVAAADGCTGAMHQASIGHVLAFKRLGWDEYVRQLKNRGADHE